MPATDPVGDEIATPAPAVVPEWIAAAAPEHAAFAATVFGEPAPAEPRPRGDPRTRGAGPDEVPGARRTARTEPRPRPPRSTPVPPRRPEPSPAPLAGLVPLTSVCDHLGVTPRMLALMRILADAPMSVGELARALSVSRPLVADLCTRLQAADLAERERDDADRRRVRVVLTAAGHLLCAETAAEPGDRQLRERAGTDSPPPSARSCAARSSEMDGTPA